MGSRAPHASRRRPSRYVFLTLLLLALGAPAGMVLAGESAQPFVVLFDQDAVSVPAQAVSPAFSGALGVEPPAGAVLGESEREVDGERVVSYVRELSVRFGMRSVDDVYTNAVGGFAAHLTSSQMRSISADPAVSAVLPDYEVDLGPEISGEAAGRVRTTGNPSDRVPAGVRRVGARSPRVTGLTSRGRSINADVAILDTGVQRDHPDLNVLGGYNCTSRNRTKWDDNNGHGTHVAGIVGAVDNRLGVTGVAPGARLWSVKVLDHNGRGFMSWLVCGVDWVTAQRDRGGRALFEVANLSLTFHLPGGNDAGCGEGSHDSLHLAICRSVRKGTVYVAAAGNESVNVRRSRPAAYDEVITVSAMADYDGRGGGRGRPSDSCPYWSGDPDDGYASFSNFGPDVDLIAPGRCIVSTYLRGRYAWMSGTSMATPHVSGAAAIYRAMYPRATPQQVRMALMAVGKLDWLTRTDPDRTHERALWVGEFRAAPDFAMSASLGSAIVPPGSELALDVSIKRVGGFDDPITITLANPPRGIRAKTAVSRQGTTTLRVEVDSGVGLGRYVLTVNAEAAGMSRTSTVSIVVRSSAPQPTFTSPRTGTHVTSDATVEVAWNERSGGAPIEERRLERESARVPAPGRCDNADYSTDYSRSNAHPLTEHLDDDRCYRWRLTLVDEDGLRSSVYSGAVLVDRSAPRAPTVTLTAESARVNVDGLGVNAAHVGHGGTLWVRAAASGSVLVNVEAFDRESGIASNVASVDPRSGWRADWIGPSVDGALRLVYDNNDDPAILRISSVNGAGLQGAAAVGTLLRDGSAPEAVHWTSARSDSTQRIKGISFRLEWAGGRDVGSGLASEHVIARYRAGLTPDGECRELGFTRDGGFRLAANRTLESNLAPNSCYVWSVRTLDNVGNSAESVISGYVITGSSR